MIYLIQEEETENVKIGYTTNLKRRLMTLQVGNSRELKVIRELEGEEKLEVLIHRYFQKNHIRGEWFNFNKKMLDPSLTSIVYLSNKKEKHSKIKQKSNSIVWECVIEGITIIE